MRLSANTETSVASVTTKSAAKLPRTAPAATRNGSPAAMSPPKTSTSRTTVSGTAMLSALARSRGDRVGDRVVDRGGAADVDVEAAPVGPP